jgi:putative acetyltransferase
MRNAARCLINPISQGEIMNLVIRNENADDYRIVEELTREAFWDVHVPGCNEHFCLHNIRTSPDFIPELDFVALIEGQIVGHILYSRANIKDQQGTLQEVLCFGPISVLPRLQKQGIGGALINHTVRVAKTMEYPAICIYGDPRYYGRFGFRCAEKYEIKTSDGKFAFALMALELKPNALSHVSGRFIESAYFEVDEKEFEEYESTFPYKEKIETDSQREFSILASLRY